MWEWWLWDCHFRLMYSSCVCASSKIWINSWWSNILSAEHLRLSLKVFVNQHDLLEMLMLYFFCLLLVNHFEKIENMLSFSFKLNYLTLTVRKVFENYINVLCLCLMTCTSNVESKKMLKNLCVGGFRACKFLKSSILHLDVCHWVFLV